MGIDSFAEIVKDNVKEQLGSSYSVTVRKAYKNNGVVYTGLNVEKEDSDIAPLIYLDSFFEKYKNGDIILPEVTGYITSISKRKSPCVDVKQFLNYDSISDRIVYKLINTKRNSELLRDIPHMEFLDLSIVFQFMLENECSSTASVLIHNCHMKLWNVTVDELFESAERNTPKRMGSQLKGITDVICEIMREETPENFDYDSCMAGLGDCVPMYVLSNRYRAEGAVCILYPKLLLDICGILKSSFYIIPSSVHEVLLLPADNTDESDEILAIVEEINNTQVAPEEILSYSLYYYDEKRQQISMV